MPGPLVTLKSRMPEIIAELPLVVGEACHHGTEEIAARIRDAAPTGVDPPWETAEHLRDSVEVKVGRVSTRGGVLPHSLDSAGVPLVAKTNAAWSILMAYWWYFIEYGTVHMAAHPFVRPGIEAAWGQVYADIQSALRSLE